MLGGFEHIGVPRIRCSFQTKCRLIIPAEYVPQEAPESQGEVAQHTSCNLYKSSGLPEYAIVDGQDKAPEPRKG